MQRSSVRAIGRLDQAASSSPLSHTPHCHRLPLPCGWLAGWLQGSIVRAIRRLEELLRQLAAALRVVGDLELAERFDGAIAKIKRDIVFAASLFL